MLMFESQHGYFTYFCYQTDDGVMYDSFVVGLGWLDEPQKLYDWKAARGMVISSDVILIDETES